MELKKIQTLRVPITGDKIPIKWLFASYILLMVVITLRYLWSGVMLARTVLPPEGADGANSADGKGGEDAS